MKSQILVKRYAQGLANALKDEGEYRTVEKELNAFSRALSSHEKLGSLMESPFLGHKKKRQIVEGILTSSSASEKSSRFLLLLLDHGRLHLLDDILDALPVLWNEKKGIVTFEVNSVVSLSEEQKETLSKQLERLEKKPVSLRYKIEPDLLAGLSLKKGNVVYDVSFKGQLARIKEKITEG